jgi:hypothetical protein
MSIAKVLAVYVCVSYFPFAIFPLSDWPLSQLALLSFAAPLFFTSSRLISLFYWTHNMRAICASTVLMAPQLAWS